MTGGPGWDNPWWGRDPIEEAGEPPMTAEEERIEWEEHVSKRLGGLEFDARIAFERLLEASPWLARQFLDDCEEQMRPRKKA